MVSIEVPTAYATEKEEKNEPIDVEYRGLTYRIASKNESLGWFHILRNLNGSCRSGRLQALMGPSGGGKTSFLDLLAGNVYGGRVEGQIFVNGVETRLKSMRKLSCYVMQHPILLSSATVREALMTSALLRLSKTITRIQKEHLVTDLMEELGLTECADVLVGSEKDDIKGISGGQIRRLAIGIELVTRPRLILLDEPTSGLDSEIALTVMLTLKSLAQNGRTVVCSIHQPNSDMVDTFDDFHLLSHGLTVYAGPWENVVPFFDRVGFPVPTYKNPTDYFMSLLKEKDIDNTIALRFEAEQRLAETENRIIPTTSAVISQGNEKNNGPTPSDVPWWSQAAILWIRFFRTWMRNPILFWSEFSQYVLVGIFIGLMYLDVGNDLNFGTNDRLASQFFVLAAMVFVPAFGAVTLWDDERKLVKVETNRKSYSLAAYFLAKTGTTWPMEIAQCFVCSLVVYWMIGYQNGAGKFLTFFIFLTMFQLISESIGILAAFLTSKSQYAIVGLSMGIIIIISFTGFIVRDIPIFFQWIQKVAYISYATAALAKSEFDGINFMHPNGTLIPGSILLRDEPFVDDALLEATREDIHVVTNDLSVGQNFGVLFAMLLGLRIICFIALTLSAKLRLL